MSTHADLRATNAGAPEREISLLHFGLTSGGAARPHRHHETELNRRFSDTVAETLQLLLQGFMVRTQKRSGRSESTSNPDVVELQRLVDFVGDFRKSQELTICGSFPLLVAQRRP